MEEVEDERAKRWFEQLEQSQDFAKYFVDTRRRAAMSIQRLARGFRERKRVSRLRKKKENDRLKELEERRRRKEQDREIERKLREAEIEKKRVDELLKQAEDAKDGAIVHTGECVLPLKRATGGSTAEAAQVSVTVREIQVPYELRFCVEEPSRAVTLKRSVGSSALESLLKPMFGGKDGARTSHGMTEIDRGMQKWVKTGRPPQRKHLIAWLLDRMWLNEDDAGHVELFSTSVDPVASPQRYFVSESEALKAYLSRSKAQKVTRMQYGAIAVQKYTYIEKNEIINIARYDVTVHFSKEHILILILSGGASVYLLHHLFRTLSSRFEKSPNAAALQPPQ